MRCPRRASASLRCDILRRILSDHQLARSAIVEDDRRGTEPTQPEPLMNEESLNLSIRKFLKMVGVSSQRDIEQAVAAAIASGALAGTETLPATMTLEIAALKVKVTFDGSIALQ